MNCPLINICMKQYIFFRLLLVSLFILQSFTAQSQLTAYPIQNFNFGTFYQGSSGGTVEISAGGSRSASGDVVLIISGPVYSQAVFEIETTAGSVMSIVQTADITLTGSNGGTITLQLETSDPASPFVTTAVPPARTLVQIGARLLIGNLSTSPPGNYNGSFFITFNQE